MTRLAHLHLDRAGPIPVARLEGEIDLSNAAEVRDSLAAVVADTARGLVVDLSDIVYLDSAGVRLLFELQRSLGAEGKKLSVVVPERSPVRRVLDVTGLTATVPTHTGLADALRAIELPDG